LIEFILRTLEKKRLEQLCDQLVMFFELISNAMKSGQTLVQAMEDAHKMIENPLQHEMTLVLQQIKMGVATGQALENFSKKVVLDDISLAVGAMNVSIKTGANLTISLRNISDTIRQRRSISQKVNSLTAQGKAEGVFVGILPVLVAFFIYMRDPNYFDPLLDTTIGILVMFLMQLIGFFIIKKITTIRV